MGVYPSIELEHLAGPMARNTIIMGWSVGEDSVSRDPFREAPDICSRESGLKVLPEWMMDGGLVVLSCSSQGCFDSVPWEPAKVRAKRVKVRELTQDFLGISLDPKCRCRGDRCSLP